MIMQFVVEAIFQFRIGLKIVTVNFKSSLLSLLEVNEIGVYCCEFQLCLSTSFALSLNRCFNLRLTSFAYRY